MIPKGFKATIYKGWEIVYSNGVNSGATATKGSITSEHFWNPNALKNIKQWIDEQEHDKI